MNVISQQTGGIPDSVGEQSIWKRLDALVEWCGERLNPILVKEARQSLKSNQFFITFSLLLVCALGWSFIGVSLLSPGVKYAPGGQFMLTGYFVILGIPLLLIVPFSAFRSIATERDDGTFELLSITSLSAWQIVSGKLGSAIVQMLVYYSALAPCIAFTYLLRGVDFATIAYVLVMTLLGSIILSSFSLAWGTLSSVRHWQIVSSVLLLIVLLFATFYWLVGFAVMISNGTFPFAESGFWIVQMGILTIGGSFVALFVLAAAARIAFDADNRSTKLRVCMLVQQTIWTGWMVLGWLKYDGVEFLYAGATFAAIYWTVAGALCSGEREQVSARVRRQLPNTVAARVFLTWFMPGPLRGYLFTVASLAAFLFNLFIASMAGSFVPRGWICFSVLLLGYVVSYLGFCRIVISAIRNRNQVSMLLSFLLHGLIIVLGAAVPYLLASRFWGYARVSYGPLQVTNWAWTLFEAARGSIDWYDPVAAFVPLAAFAFVVANIALHANEIRQLRTAVPERVTEEELLLHPPEVVDTRQGPWD